MSNHYFIGIDVGTGSARAGIFDQAGRMLAASSNPIKMWKPETNYVEQSSDDIWGACCRSVKETIEQANVNPEDVKGLGFDATCSLVVLGPDDQPLTVSPTNENKRNVIVWMDHRAMEQAQSINQTQHTVLNYVGGTISPEMETPKLLWLKEHKPRTWQNAARFFDLPDFLVYKATGVDVRSVCTTTCKWTYLAHKPSKSRSQIGCWDDSYFTEIGLGDLVDENYSRIGQQVRPVGESVGNGLTEEAAKQMGLRPKTAVSISIIDAHAGGLGLLGMKPSNSEDEPKLEQCIALIGGTSSCHMAVSREPKFIDGVWGPYYSALLPDMWLTEGGQSATGALIDHIIFSSKQSVQLEKQAEREDTTVYELLNEKLYQLKEQKELPDVGHLTEELHILPYFHGNRSPRANPSLLGSISGLKLSSTTDDLALQYLAAIQGIAYGTRHIIETLNQQGYAINTIMATGGGTKNELFLKEHADICGCKIILPRENEAVLLGSAVLGAVAAGIYPTVREAMRNLNKAGNVIYSTKGDVENFHNAKYEIFHEMYRNQQSYAKKMAL